MLIKGKRQNYQHLTGWTWNLETLWISTDFALNPLPGHRFVLFYVNSLLLEGALQCEHYKWCPNRT